MIKSYVVRIKNVKVNRLDTFIKYLNNEKHKNHTKKNTVITELSNRETFQKSCSDKVWKNSENFIKRAHGGVRLKVIGKSLTFNIPTQFEVNDQSAANTKDLILEGIKSLYNSYGYDLQEEEVYMVEHRQDNSHWHLIVPYLDMEGKPMRFVKPRRFHNELKLLWNEIMINTYGVSLEDYQPLNENRHRIFLEELKEDYMDLEVLEEDTKTQTYIKNQMIVIDRLLRLEDNELDQEEETLKRLEKNLDKVLKNQNKNNIRR